MLVILAVAACCGLPLLVAGLLALTGKKRQKTQEADEAQPIEVEKNP
ncbi:MAG: hypothetical protein ACE5KI_01320 [Dehalococcoidia bacterium]